MLLEISIEQFALIESVRLQFAGGLNVLTGETGAGKSIILDAVQAVLGGRTSSDVVRAGEERAIIEAIFDLTGHQQVQDTVRALGIDVDEDQLLLIRREINRNGRGTIRVNGRTVTAGMLKEATNGLVDLHGQHEHQSLLQVEKHLDLLDQYGGSLLHQEDKSLDLLDQYGGAPLVGLRAEVAAVVESLSTVHHELSALIGDERDRARKEDLLRFQVDELSAAKLRPGEEEDLEAERNVLAHAGKLKLGATNCYLSLYEGMGRQLSASDLLGRAQSELDEMVRHDPSLGEAIELIGSALVHVQEASRFLVDYRDRVDDDPARLVALESRLDQIHTLKRKYGDTTQDMIAYLAQVKQELDRLEHSQELIDRLQAKELQLGIRAEELAGRLTQLRRQAAEQLSLQVIAQLAELGMNNARFSVQVAVPAGASYRQISLRGWDRVEFLFSPNPGEPQKPLAKIVSGGEMSRIMLALKVILAKVDGIPTLVFDEVDAGISGRAAQAVGEKLARIATSCQVLCVSHLPQVAALASHHFLIAKETAAGRTTTSVMVLDDDGRCAEIARTIGGTEVSAFTIEAARDMLVKASAWKANL